MNALTILTIVLAASYPASAFAQGTVLFRNDEASLVKIWGTIDDPTTLLDVPPFTARVQLAYAPAGTPSPSYAYGWNEAEWLAANAGWTLGPTAEFVDRGLFDAGIVTLEGIAPGAEAEYVVFGWTPPDVSFFEFFVFLGISDQFTTRTGEPGAPVPLADSFRGLEIKGVVGVPEPSICALVLLALGVLLVRRR